MRKIIRLFVGGLFVVMSVATAIGKTVSEIKSDGIYIAGEAGFVKVEPYSRYDNFVEFSYLNEIPYVKREGDVLKILVHQKDFNESSIRLEVRPVKTVVDVKEVKFEVRQLEKSDLYELLVKTPVKDGTMLHVHSWMFDNMGVIMLGKTEKVLVEYFSQNDLPNAPVVVQYLDDAIKAFPANAALKKLKGHWNKAAESEKDINDYKYVEEKWKQYEEAEKLTLKSRYLEALIVEINGYLNQHPHGLKSEEANKRKEFAEKKLKEYEKLI